MRKGLLSVVLLIYLCYEKTKPFNLNKCICRAERGAPLGRRGRSSLH